MKPTNDQIESDVISGLELLNEEDEESFFTPAEVRERIEESHDWDSDNLKRGRLDVPFEDVVAQKLEEFSALIQLPQGYSADCRIEKQGDKFRFLVVKEEDHDCVSFRG